MLPSRSVLFSKAGMNFREGSVEVIVKTIGKIMLGTQFCYVGWTKLRNVWIAELHFRLCRDRNKNKYMGGERTMV